MVNLSISQRGLSGSSIRFVSWNVRGLGGPIKRSRVFSHLRSLKTDIAFLQETHLCINDHFRMRKPWVGQIFHSAFNSKSRGAAILINKRTQFLPDQIISDPHGRYVIVSGKLYQTSVVLVNVYAPNWDNPNFMTSLFSKIPNLDTHRLILGGDLNLVIDPKLDRSHPKVLIPSAMSKTLSSIMSQLGCIDAWRLRHPFLKEFSYFSKVHQSYSRIDYFFIDSALLPAVKSTEYSAIAVSDHAPHILDLALLPVTTKQWKFNTGLLAKDEFCNYISKKIGVFLDSNKTESTSPSLLWETLKAVIRGDIISYSTHLARKNKQKQQELIDAILSVDREYSSSPNPELYAKRIKLQSDYDLLSTNKAEYLLRRTKGTYYEYGDKASRLLALQLKRQSASNFITQIYDSSHSLTTNPAEINSTFASYYSNLYQSESPSK